VDVKYRGKSSAVIGRDVSLVKFDILDGVVVEYREKSHEVGGVVNRGLIKQDQVLVRAPPLTLNPLEPSRPTVLPAASGWL